MNESQNKVHHQIRCPLCNGRLFDIVTGEASAQQHPISCVVMIKCWKCHQEIEIINFDLVQTPRIMNYGAGV